MATAIDRLRKYASFVGPGIMVSVAYMDPGNYSTAVSSGASYEYKLLFVIFMLNLFAVVLQCLCIKLGTVTGLDLAEMCRLHLPPWLNISLYLGAELAIVATDLAEVVGTAISLEILFGIPMLYGVLLTVLDVLVVLVAYDRDGDMKQTRVFETLVAFLVLSTCCCFVIELFKCDFAPGSFKAIVEGFLPMHREVFKEPTALFLSCGIVGSTVMPHSLFLGSALVQSRLKEYDSMHGVVATEGALDDAPATPSLHDASDHKFSSLTDPTPLTHKYKPSLEAIRYCLNYSYAELVFSLFLLAVFVNSAILIVAGSTLYGKPDAEEADLLSIYEMLSVYISPAAGIVFALSMLFSGQSAGIVCTMAGQIVSEGFINWSFKPWKRRLVTRGIAVVPVLIVIGILGREGVSKIMNSSQVVLSFILPLVTAPLIWFTTKKQFMSVHKSAESEFLGESTVLLTGGEVVTFENGVFFTVSSVLTWLIITFLNLYLIYAFANGADI
jgi:metal iron transporter